MQAKIRHVTFVSEVRSTTMLFDSITFISVILFASRENQLNLLRRDLWLSRLSGVSFVTYLSMHGCLCVWLFFEGVRQRAQYLEKYFHFHFHCKFTSQYTILI